MPDDGRLLGESPPNTISPLQQRFDSGGIFHAIACMKVHQQF